MLLLAFLFSCRAILSPCERAFRCSVGMFSPLRLQNTCFLVFCLRGLIQFCAMDDIVRLEENSQSPATQLPFNRDSELPIDLVDDESPLLFVQGSSRGGMRDGGRSNTGRSTPVSSQTQAGTSHKVRGPNWTEAEMLVLIEQKRNKWDGRHNSNQPSMAKFVYGTTAWKLVLSGCMKVASFRARDTDQITNKWDGLIKDYKKLKDYIEGTGSANWWGMSRDEKKQLSKTRKMPLEFSEAMYAEMEGFVGRRQIFGRAADVVDSNGTASPASRHFGRSPTTARETSSVGAGSPIASATAASESPTATTPGHDTPGSTGRKRKAIGTDNLVDFVKDFNHEYLARVEAQDAEIRTWRTDVLAFDTAREARLTRRESKAADMEEKFYNLEVERTRNLGNMTTALFMLASSMDTLTRFVLPPTPISI